MSDRDKFRAFFLGFLVGGLTGAIAALLFTPQSGEETRALIKDKAIELRDRSQVSAEEAIARADELARQLRERSKEVVDDVRKRIESRVEARYLHGDSTTDAPPPTVTSHE